MIKITHPQILAFFDQFPNVDPETVFLNCVQFLESSAALSTKVDKDCIIAHMQRMQSAIADQLKHTLTSQLHDQTFPLVSRLHESLVDKLQVLLADIPNKSKESMHEIEKQLISMRHDTNQLKQTLSLQLTDQTLSPLVTRLHESLVDKLQVMLADIPIKSKEGMHAIEKQLISMRHESNFAQLETNIKNTVSGITSQIVESAKVQSIAHQDMKDFFQKFTNNSAVKGRIGETRLLSTLGALFPTADITNTSGRFATCDVILSRKVCDGGGIGGRPPPDIAFENKEYAANANVPIAEVNKFRRDIAKRGIHGIFLSQNGGIAGKRNFEIEIHDASIIMIYLHCVAYCPEIIRIAVDCIDHLHMRFAALTRDNSRTLCVNLDTQQSLLQELQAFMSNRAQLISLLQDNYKVAVAKVNELQFPELHQLLTTGTTAANAGAAAVASEEDVVSADEQTSPVVTTTVGHKRARNREKLVCRKCGRFESLNTKLFEKHVKHCL